MSHFVLLVYKENLLLVDKTFVEGQSSSPQVVSLGDDWGEYFLWGRRNKILSAQRSDEIACYWQKNR